MYIIAHGATEKAGIGGYKSIGAYRRFGRVCSIFGSLKKHGLGAG